MNEIEYGKIRYRQLDGDEICRELFSAFIRHQNVTKCWRKEKGEWLIKDVPFVDDWSEEDYQTLIVCLKNTYVTGGFVYGAFYDGVLKGFVSVESELFGGEHRYLDLSSIHVSEDMRGKGIGKELFLAAAKWAKSKGAAKLYISAHSAVESQAFYKAMGCVEAQMHHQKHVEAEPFDCQLEFVLSQRGMDKQAVYEYLRKEGILYTMVEHPPAFTVEDMESFHLPNPQAGAKNLFLRDDKKKNYYLFSIQCSKTVDMKMLQEKARTRRLSFASEDDLLHILKLKKGAVTPFGILNDEERIVKVYFDSFFQNREIWVHPNDNTASVYIRTKDLFQMIRSHGNEAGYIDIP